MPVKHRPLFAGKLKKGTDGNWYHKLDAVNQSALNKYAEGIGESVPVKADYSRITKKKIRSVEQNNYYWGVVLKILGEHTGYISKSDQEMLHGQLGGIFLVKQGEFGNYVESTTVLSTELFERYLEAVRQWALEFHGLRIPLPNEVITSDDYVNI